MKLKTPYFLAANSYEGCGHKHRTARAAIPCAERMRVGIYMITGTGRKDHDLVMDKHGNEYEPKERA